MVFMNSNYSLDSTASSSLNLDYDFKKLQSALQQKLLDDKPSQINVRSVRTFEFSDEINDKSRFELLNLKVAQRELSAALKEALSAMYKQPNQLSEIIRKLRICIDFISSSGCSSAETKISDYATHVLKMGSLTQSGADLAGKKNRNVK